MGDAESGGAGRPSLQRSMSKRGSFAKQFRDAHQVLPFDQTLQIYHLGCLCVCVVVAVLLGIFGNNTSVLFAIAVLLGASFFGYLLVNPPDRVELYENRVVVRLKIGSKFLVSGCLQTQCTPVRR